MILLIIKILITLAGLSAAIFFWLIGLTNRSQPYVRTGWIVGLTTVGLIGAIMFTEFLLRDERKENPDKETVLVAKREAALSGIHLRVYTDSLYELGDGINVTMRGKIRVRRDTLFLLREDSVAKSFVLDNVFLKEVKNTGVRFLEIESNEILKAN